VLIGEDAFRPKRIVPFTHAGLCWRLLCHLFIWTLTIRGKATRAINTQG